MAAEQGAFPGPGRPVRSLEWGGPEIASWPLPGHRGLQCGEENVSGTPVGARRGSHEATAPSLGQGSDALVATWQERGLLASEAVPCSGQGERGV